MGQIQKYKDLIGRRAADDDLEELAVDLLKAAVANKGNWTGLWDGVLARVHDLPPQARSRIADGLVTQYHSEQAGPNARENALILLGIVSRDLPPHDRLAAERVALLDGISRHHSFWYGARYEHLIEAELAAGHPIAPAVVATVRRSVLHAYQNEDLPRTAKKLTEPPLNVGEAWAEQALRDAAGDSDWQALLAHAATATAAKPNAKWDQRATALIAALGPDQVRETALPWLALAGRRPAVIQQLQPGDLVFFRTRELPGGRIGHIGIYLGLDTADHPRFISSRKNAGGPTMGDKGGTSRLDGDGYYAQGLRGARRL